MYTRGLEPSVAQLEALEPHGLQATPSLDQSHPLLGMTMTETHVLCARYPLAGAHLQTRQQQLKYDDSIK